MAKNRKSKRQLIRDEKRAKKRTRDVEDAEPEAKRQRREPADLGETADYIPLEDDDDVEITLDAPPAGGPSPPTTGGRNFELEFFGRLADEEQEYFRRADELLELNDFPTTEERDLFLANVYKEAAGKELKIASSQSCSRLMERLILLSNTRQKKHLFGAFAGHFISLITHRFAGHCCEKLFMLSAQAVTRELMGEGEDEGEAEGEGGAEPQASMEELFLLTLDELEEHLPYLVSDRYGSHALRALLITLSGRPLNQVGTKSLLQSKKKEYVTVEGATGMSSEFMSETRAVPESFAIATQKIIGDVAANLDATGLRVLAKHPTGNPTLQLLLDLEFSLSAKTKKSAPKKKKKGEVQEEEVEEAPQVESLLEKLVPGAPASFSDEKSPAAEFVNSMMYDVIGSRLLETLITHCPGKIFKGLLATFFAPRIHSLLRNDIASYPAIRVLNRLSKEDLADAVEKSLPQIADFVQRGRFNVIKTFFERCQVRQATPQLNSLLQALTSALGNDWKHFVPKLCLLNEKPPADDAKKASFQPEEVKNKSALLSHGSQLVSALLSIPGSPSKAIQTSITSLSSAQLLKMATESPATSAILVKALSTPSQSPTFHKVLVASLLPHTYEIATSQHGSPIINAIIATPSKGEGISVPFHAKENMMSQLERHERELRESWLGRNVWRTWKGDLWSHRRHDWVRWAKEAAPETARVAAVPKPRVKEEAKEEGKASGKGSGGRWPKMAVAA
ncbi:armadillo-type protein [Cercophora newfieldiana]|uniref:Nucleolar protein 9 n=1 Tax=Cercophora newfieldiana TaxID=92897 RepID=A0AA40CSX4_9PEZI|nr:armadillo-type protein [Cercophora newfieldiana]